MISRSVENFFHLQFSVIWMGSRSTVILCTALSLISAFRVIRHITKRKKSIPKVCHGKSQLLTFCCPGTSSDSSPAVCRIRFSNCMHALHSSIKCHHVGATPPRLYSPRLLIARRLKSGTAKTVPTVPTAPALLAPCKVAVVVFPWTYHIAHSLQVTDTTHTHTYTHTHTDTHTHTHRYTHSHIHTQIHTHTQIYTHTDTHTHRYTHTHTDIHTHTQIHTHTDIHTHTHRDTHTHRYTHTQIHTHTQIYTHTHTYRYTHTDTHTHTHTHYIHTCSCPHG